jgi:hypothetical protein
MSRYVTYATEDVRLVQEFDALRERMKDRKAVTSCSIRDVRGSVRVTYYQRAREAKSIERWADKYTRYVEHMK